MNFDNQVKHDLEYYLNLPQIQQRTDAWLKAREGTITATNVATILELNEYSTKLEMFQRKTCNIDEQTQKVEQTSSKINREMEDPTAWGETFEAVAQRLCQDRYSTKIYDLGLRFHEKVNWLGASPDGISEVSGSLRDFIANNAEGYLMQNNVQIPDLILFEFKCPIWRKITKQIPFGYWVQMQVQMEVWGLDSCIYSEHKFAKFDTVEQYDSDDSPYKGIIEQVETGEMIYWKVEEYWDQVVFRDQEWFKKVFPTIQDFYHQVIQERQTEQLDNVLETTHNNSDIIRGEISFKTIDWGEYSHTQDITNYFLDDPLLDWLNKYGDGEEVPEYVKRDPQSPYSLQNFVLGKYLEFREHVYDYLKYFYPEDYVDITNDPFLPDPNNLHYQLLIKYQSRSCRNLNRTLEAMRKRVPIIMNALVYNPEQKTYGRIDVLIQKNWLEKVFQKRPILEAKTWMPPTSQLVEIKPDVFMIDTQTAENKARKEAKRAERRRKCQTKRQSETEPVSGKKRKRDGELDNENETENSNNKNKIEKADYVMVQIKYASVNLAANGLNLLNNQKQKIYKGHSTLLNQALGYTLEYINQEKTEPPKYSYILGRKSNFKSKSMNYQTDSFLNSLGVVDYESRDQDYVQSYNEALAWIQRLRAEGDKWNINVNTGADDQSLVPLLEIPELYPNMKNDRDHPWHSTKKKLAENIGELTMLLNLGVDKRRELHNQKIYTWKQLTPELIDQHKLRQKDILKSMLQAVNENRIVNLDQIDHPVINDQPDLEFYIDFETVSDLQDDFSKLPWTNGQGIIYMVGCYAKNNLTGQASYYNYLVDHLTEHCERKMIRDWIKDMENLIDQVREERERRSQNTRGKTAGGELEDDSIHDSSDSSSSESSPPKKRLKRLKRVRDKNVPKTAPKTRSSKDKTKTNKGTKTVKQNKTPNNTDYQGFPTIHMFHWSQAEKNQLDRALEKHAADILVNYDLDLIDLYELFKQERVGLPGLFRYGLKNVSKVLYQMGVMKTIWPDDLDGSQAMVAAWKADEVAKQAGKTMSEIDFMEPIIRYNYVDCKVLEEIVDYLRSYNGKN